MISMSYGAAKAAVSSYKQQKLLKTWRPIKQ